MKKLTYQEQKALKPNIEDVIHTLLKGGKARGALDFVAFAKSLRMTPQWACGNSWTLNYKNKRVAYFRLYADEKDWGLWLYAQYDAHFASLLAGEPKEIQEYFLSNIVYCYGCGACAPGKDVELLGRELHNVCATPTFRLRGLNAAFRDFSKRAVILRREAIAAGRVPKVAYIAMKDRK